MKIWIKTENRGARLWHIHCFIYSPAGRSGREIVCFMRRFIALIAILLSAGLAARAQDKTTLQNRIDQWKNYMEEFQQKQEPDRAAARILDTLKWNQAGISVAKKSFVIEADAVTFKNGVRVIVNSMTNFIAVDGDRGVVQISPSNFSSGPNGVGGITVDGTISNYQVTTDKKGVTHVSMNVTGAIINATVDIDLYPGTDQAHVTVSPNFNSRTIRIDGTLVPYSSSRIVEGVSI